MPALPPPGEIEKGSMGLGVDIRLMKERYELTIGGGEGLTGLAEGGESEKRQTNNRKVKMLRADVCPLSLLGLCETGFIVLGQKKGRKGRLIQECTSIIMGRGDVTWAVLNSRDEQGYIGLGQWQVDGQE